MQKLILVMGLPGSGKSFFAERLAAALGAEYLSSDRERNRIGKRGRYSPDDKLTVYQHLVDLAKTTLKNEQTVVVDATFHLQQMRDLFSNLAAEQGAAVFYFNITAADELIRERLQKPRNESQADFSVHQVIKDEFELFPMKVITLESKEDNIASLLKNALKLIEHEKE